MTERIDEKYTVLSKIDSGGFGTVYRCRDPEGKLVAVKVCNKPEREQDFIVEAAIVQALDHPNIVSTIAFGLLEGGSPYLVMELLSGENLRDLLEKDVPIPVIFKLRYLLQIAEGIAFAHSKKVIHRDIKPSNIRVLEDGRIKIMDFGLAKIVPRGAGNTSNIIGTLEYMAPEQLSEEEVDGRGRSIFHVHTYTDVFSFGVVAFQFLTSPYRHPFIGRDWRETAKNIATKEIDFSDDWSIYSADLKAIVRKCLAKKASDRFQSMQEVLPALRGCYDELIAQGEEVTKTHPSELVRNFMADRDADGQDRDDDSSSPAIKAPPSDYSLGEDGKVTPGGAAPGGGNSPSDEGDSPGAGDLLTEDDSPLNRWRRLKYVAVLVVVALVSGIVFRLFQLPRIRCTAEARATAIEIQCTLPEINEIDKYEIYRVPGPDEPEGYRGEKGDPSLAFQDQRDLLGGTVYTYWVHAISKEKEVLAESREVQVRYEAP